MLQETFFPTKPKSQLWKWVGNKFRFADEIVRYFPSEYNCFFEPFVGTGAVLATLQPKKAFASDTLLPLVKFWHLLQENPSVLIDHYDKHWQAYIRDAKSTYLQVKSRYNMDPNPLDLMFISRTCYGGVIRFTKENKISTPNRLLMEARPPLLQFHNQFLFVI